MKSQPGMSPSGNAAPANAPSAESRRMALPDALAVLHGLRRDEIVLATMAMAREWHKISSHPLDLHHVPASMGHTASLGVGLALGLPDREIVVLNGDGSLLMNLGVLVTIVHEKVANYTMIVADNGVYEITGNQATAGDVADYPALAKASGFPTAFSCRDIDDWRARAPELWRLPGPRFVSLVVAPDRESFRLPVPRDLADRVRQFQADLAVPRA